MQPLECPQHKIVSLVGNIAADGTASFYDVIVRFADAVQAPHYPMPLPVIASTSHERQVFFEQASVRHIVSLATSADVTYVGVGDLGENPPLLQDGFISRKELQILNKAGAVGEIVGWAFDAEGRLIEGLTNDRVASVKLESPAQAACRSAFAWARRRSERSARRSRANGCPASSPTSARRSGSSDNN